MTGALPYLITAIYHYLCSAIFTFCGGPRVLVLDVAAGHAEYRAALNATPIIRPRRRMGWGNLNFDDRTQLAFPGTDRAKRAFWVGFCWRC